MSDAEQVLDVEQLLRDLRGEDLQVSKKAARVLGLSGNEQFLAPLLDYIADKRRLNRSGVVYGLCRFDPDLVLQPLLSALSDEAWTVRCGAFDAFARIGEIRAIPAMIDLLKSMAGGEEETDALGERIDWSMAVYIRQIGRMCCQVGNSSLFQEAIEPLRHFLNDPSEAMRLAAAKSLSDLGYLSQPS